MVEIKELSESGGLSLDNLKEEISKHINPKEENIPGSISQLLVGCIGDDICPINKKEQVDDVPFIYDSKKGILKSLSKNNQPLTDET